MSDVVIGDDGSPKPKEEPTKEIPDPNPQHLTAAEVYKILGIPFKDA
jgi:hypothetical protein